MTDDLKRLQTEAAKAVERKLMTSLTPVKRTMGIFYSIDPSEIGYVEMLNELVNGFAVYTNALQAEASKYQDLAQLSASNVYRGYRIKALQAIIAELAQLDNVTLDEVIPIDFLGDA